VDVLLGAQIDAEVGERRLEGGEHALSREERVPVLGAEDARRVPPLRLVESDTDAVAEELVGGVLVQPLGRLEQIAALVGEIVEAEGELPVQLDVVRRPELVDGPLADLDRVEVDRVQVLVRELRAGIVESAPHVAVVGVRDRGPEHAVPDAVAVYLGLELRLETRDPLGVAARQAAEVPLARETPQLPDPPVAVDGGAERLCAVEARQVGVPLVDRVELERLLQAREMDVVLLVELRDEAVCLRAVGLELRGAGRLGLHSS
jgi:hypothetical protein